MYTEARTLIGNEDKNVYEHSLPSKSFYSNIKNFTHFSHFKCGPLGIGSYNLNYCVCSNCEDGKDCLHPGQKGAIHNLVINKVDTSGGEINCDDKKETKMELTNHEEGVVSTIAKNGNEARALNKGTIVISFNWDEESEKTSIQVGVLRKNNSFESFIYHRDEHDDKCFHKSEDIVLLEQGNIRLATISGSITVPD